MIKFFDRNREYFEFSNYYESPIVIDGLSFLSVEQYYQSQKFNTDSTREYYELICECDSSQKAKDVASQRVNTRGASWLINKSKPHLGKMNDVVRKYKSSVHLRQDWEDIKVDVMRRGLQAKFQQNENLKKLLLSTGDAEIVEDSPYDSFWGAARNGKNMLGKLLMEVRQTLKE
jgi:hypothetical protein